jgi:hypothetical protein
VFARVPAFATNCPVLHAPRRDSSRGRTTARGFLPKPLAVTPARSALARSSSTVGRDATSMQLCKQHPRLHQDVARRRARTPTRHASVAVACVTGRGGAKVGRATSSAALQLPDDACMPLRISEAPWQKLGAAALSGRIRLCSCK